MKTIVFSNITMSNVGTPIVIDQYYCGGHKICNETDMKNALAISDVAFKGISGTYSYKPISLACSHINPCRNLTVATVDLVPTSKKKEAAQPYCIYAYGRVLNDTTPPLYDCLEPQEAPSPSPSSTVTSPSPEAVPSPSPAAAPSSDIPSPSPTSVVDPPGQVLMKGAMGTD